MITSLDLTGISSHVSEAEIDQAIEAHAADISRVMQGALGGPADLGWFSPSRWLADPLVEMIRSLAEEIRSNAEVFLLVGVGGSNRGAQSLIETLGDRQVEIIYTGDTLSSQAWKDTLARIRGRSTYANVIAKDFNTLEPGIAFRMLRRHMQDAYGEDYRKRIIVTGSAGSGQLKDLSERHGYPFLPFPADMGGRFSVLSAVGLLPAAVAGIDIAKLIQGAASAERELTSLALKDNPACRYAAARNVLFERGFLIENLVTLEPSMSYFARWWSQLFGESEGKNQRCIFPTASSYSEDLHAIGQYIQQGKRMIMETYLDARFYHPELVIQADAVNDGFAYLDDKPFDALNTAAYHAAYSAHCQDGVPCIQFHCGEINAPLLGELFYLFMLSCCISAVLINVDPYGQPGVEAYKRNMMRALGKTA